MKYKSVIVTSTGDPQVLQAIESKLGPPGPVQARIKILALPVCAPDITPRYGQSPFSPKPPFKPGYAFIGNVDALGAGVTDIAVGDRVAALTAYGSYAEFINWDAEHLIPVPASLDPATVGEKSSS